MRFPVNAQAAIKPGTNVLQVLHHGLNAPNHGLRDGRYVIPVRTDAHDKIPGIVHGTSSSGATAFVEPRAVVDQQNRLTLAISEMEREEQRILAQLSDLVRERAGELGAALDALDLADLRDASARLAEDERRRDERALPVVF